MFNLFKWLRNRKARHIAEVYATEIHPEEYLRREREIRRDNIIEVVSAILLIPIVIFLIKAWFAYEGFSVQW